tara:strand:+ start:32 stop:568 length:537 start_codon:yes stop_codon:yes gene_type:complete
MKTNAELIDIFGEDFIIEDQSPFKQFMTSVGKNIEMGMPLIDSIKTFGIDRALEMTGLDPQIQKDLKMKLPNDEIAANFILPKILDTYSLPSPIKNALLTGNLSMQKSLPILNKAKFNIQTNVDKAGRATGNIGVRYKPTKKGFIEAGAKFDSKQKPKFEISFGRKFSNGGIVSLIKN